MLIRRQPLDGLLSGLYYRPLGHPAHPKQDNEDRGIRRPTLLLPQVFKDADSEYKKVTSDSTTSICQTFNHF